jgi:hypothetical protein
MTGIDQITAEFDSSRVRSICSEIHKLIDCIRNKDELPEQSKLVDNQKGDTPDCT